MDSYPYKISLPDEDIYFNVVTKYIPYSLSNDGTISLIYFGYDV